MSLQDYQQGDRCRSNYAGVMTQAACWTDVQPIWQKCYITVVETPHNGCVKRYVHTNSQFDHKNKECITTIVPNVLYISCTVPVKSVSTFYNFLHCRIIEKTSKLWNNTYGIM